MKNRARCVLLTFLLLFPFSQVIAQEIRALKHEISSLCSPTMSGRGYVQKGRDRAAMHIMRKMRDAGLQPVTPDS
ncbi:MAG: hypothetical protein EOP49_22065, partial [Sphingobacteriales bacterium]